MQPTIPQKVKTMPQNNTNDPQERNSIREILQRLISAGERKARTFIDEKDGLGERAKDALEEKHKRLRDV